MIVPKLPHITVLSIGLSQMFVPAIIRLLFDFKGRKTEDGTPEKKSKTCFAILNGVIRFFVFIMFLVHFAVIGYNAYIRNLDETWIALLYLYIIWSSLKYAANYLKVDNKIFPPNKNFETDCMRSWIASIFQIISKINFELKQMIWLIQLESVSVYEWICTMIDKPDYDTNLFCQT